jgi:hypothetical protein
MLRKLVLQSASILRKPPPSRSFSTARGGIIGKWLNEKKEYIEQQSSILKSAMTAESKFNFQLPLLIADRNKTMTVTLSDIAGHTSFLCLAFGYLGTDLFNLRLFAISGICFSIVFQYYRERPLWIPIRWNALFLVINIGMILLLLKEDVDANNIKEEEKLIYQNAFERKGMTPIDFFHLILDAKRIEAKKGDLIIDEKKRNSRVFFVKSGSLAVKQGGVKSRTIEENQFVGAMSFLVWEKKVDKVKHMQIQEVKRKLQKDSLKNLNTDSGTELFIPLLICMEYLFAQLSRRAEELSVTAAITEVEDSLGNLAADSELLTYSAASGGAGEGASSSDPQQQQQQGDPMGFLRGVDPLVSFFRKNREAGENLAEEDAVYEFIHDAIVSSSLPSCLPPSEGASSTPTSSSAGAEAEQGFCAVVPFAAANDPTTSYANTKKNGSGRRGVVSSSSNDDDDSGSSSLPLPLQQSHVIRRLWSRSMSTIGAMIVHVSSGGERPSIYDAEVDVQSGATFSDEDEDEESADHNPFAPKSIYHQNFNRPEGSSSSGAVRGRTSNLSQQRNASGGSRGSGASSRGKSESGEEDSSGTATDVSKARGGPIKEGYVSVVCEEDCVLYYWSFRRLRALIDLFPSLGVAFERLLLEDINDKMSQSMAAEPKIRYLNKLTTAILEGEVGIFYVNFYWYCVSQRPVVVVFLVILRCITEK